MCTELLCSCFNKHIHIHTPWTRERNIKVKSLSCVRLFATPGTCSLPGSFVHGIFQAIVLEWITISLSRGSSKARDRTKVSHIANRCFTATRLIPGIELRAQKYTHTYRVNIYLTREPRILNGEKVVFFNKWFGKTGYSHAKE